MPLDTPPPNPVLSASHPAAEDGTGAADAMAAWQGDAFPLIRDARGAHLTDGSGQRLLDLDNADGAVLLGHGDPAVARSIARAAAQGIAGLPSVLAAELAARLSPALPSGFQTLFLPRADAALAAAIAVARAATGRRAVIAAGVGFDAAPVEGPLRRAAPGDVAALEAALLADGGGVAAILADPAGDPGSPGDWPRVVQAAARRHGALVIFDERRSFLRLGLGGATLGCGIAPDLLCHGQDLANGLPMAALSGDPGLLGRVANHAPVPGLEGHAAAAAHTVLDRLAVTAVPAALAQAGAALRDGFEMALAAAGLHGAYRLDGPATCMTLHAVAGRPALRRLAAALAGQGVFLRARINLSLAFGTMEVLEATTAFARALRQLRRTEERGLPG
ncbi:MAG: aminotransferase class III-fold pyridoxal phosphate-dependent enzyme [Acetobacteraceae bacterium]|nr:aminotransferase class III-fold pyridoxal phosphate-dependent enzyme [Acetobacteraceae bacterium]